MKTFACPHCGTTVPAHALVCVGCHAEVVRGITRRERGRLGWVVTPGALLVAMIIFGRVHYAHPNDVAPFVLLKIIGIVILANVVTAVVTRMLFRSRVSFIRSYRHQ